MRSPLHKKSLAAEVDDDDDDDDDDDYPPQIYSTKPLRC